MDEPIISRLGIECQLFVGQIPGETPTDEDLLEEIRDVNLLLEGTQVDVTTRKNKNWKAHVPGLMDATLEITYVAGIGDTDKIFSDAFDDKEVLPIFVGMDGEGLDADWQVLSISEPQELDNAIIKTVQIKPSFAEDREPEWIDDGPTGEIEEEEENGEEGIGED